MKMDNQHNLDLHGDNAVDRTQTVGQKLVSGLQEYSDTLKSNPPVRPDAPDTSHEAAESMRPHVSRLAMKVVAALWGNEGRTCQEIEQYLGMSHQTCSARIWELQKALVVRDSGKRRKTTSGRNAIVWVISQEGTT